MTSLNAKVAMMSFFPNIAFNNQRKGPSDDYFVGLSSSYYNNIMRKLDLNATLIKSQTIGTCHTNGSCSGLFSLLKTGVADFSLLPLPYQMAINAPVSSDDPVVYGPFSNVESIRILSLPITMKRVVKVDLMQIYVDTSYYVYLVMILSILLIYIISNWPFYSNKKRKITLFSLSTVFINNQLISRPKIFHSFIMICFYYIFTTLVIKIVCGSINSELIKVYPEKYYESLKQLVNDIEMGKARANCVNNYRAHSTMLARDEVYFKKLMRRIETFNTRTLIASEMKINSSALVAFDGTISFIKTFFCGFFESYYFSLHQSEPILTQQTAIAMSSKINPLLRQRVTSIFTRIFHSGLFSKYITIVNLNTASICNVLTNSIHNCESKLKSIKYHKQQVTLPMSINLDSTLIIIKFYIAISTVAYFINKCECLVHKIT